MKLMEKNGTNVQNSMILLLVILFCYNGFIFINTQGSDHPLLISLFVMVIILAALIILYHKKEFIGGQKELIGQTYLEKYFKKQKRLKW